MKARLTWRVDETTKVGKKGQRDSDSKTIQFNQEIQDLVKIQ